MIYNQFQTHKVESLTLTLILLKSLNLCQNREYHVQENFTDSQGDIKELKKNTFDITQEK